tara:strand:+ start:437 stop:745 length:309 start_codon:yes stop_codon:yes gene_type:complete
MASDYFCRKCDTNGVKLWRVSHSFSVDLLCGSCALEETGKEGPINPDGYRISEYGRTDQIGWRVPAIPDPLPPRESHSYWGYTSVPEEGVKWWRDLPVKQRG